MPDPNRRLNIVLVYLGNRPPSYVRSNLNHLRIQFPGATTWLITDSENIKKHFERRGHNVWLFQKSSGVWSDIDAKMNFPREFRGGFWFLTLKRFKAIEDFMLQNPSALLHVEADVFLMPNFPLTEISSIEKNLAFPSVGVGYAIASTFFVRTRNAIKDFNDFVESSSKENPNAIDMTLLYEYANAYPDRVELLPSGPSYKGKTKGYFDGAAFGTFLTGQDPRNFRGVRIKYSQVDWHSDKISDLDFAIVGNELISILGETKLPIYSLHIHSKKAKLFQVNGLMKELHKSLKEYKKGPKKVIAPAILIRIVANAIDRRLRKVIKSG